MSAGSGARRAPTRSMPAMAGIAVGADVVGDDEAAVGPGDDHGALEAGLVDDRGEVVGPEPLVGVAAGVERLARTCRARGCRT